MPAYIISDVTMSDAEAFQTFLSKDLQPFTATATEVYNPQILIAILQEGYVGRILPEPDKDLLTAAAVTILKLAIENFQKRILHVLL